MPETLTKDENELLTPRQAAKRLKLSYYTILRWIKLGLIRAVDVNPSAIKKQYRIKASELTKLMVRVKSDKERGLEDTPPGSELGDVKIVD